MNRYLLIGDEGYEDWWLENEPRLQRFKKPLKSVVLADMFSMYESKGLTVVRVTCHPEEDLTALGPVMKGGTLWGARVARDRRVPRGRVLMDTQPGNRQRPPVPRMMGTRAVEELPPNLRR